MDNGYVKIWLIFLNITKWPQDGSVIIRNAEGECIVLLICLTKRKLYDSELRCLDFGFWILGFGRSFLSSNHFLCVDLSRFCSRRSVSLFLENHTVSVSETNVTSIEIVCYEFVNTVFMLFCIWPLFAPRENGLKGEEKG